MPNEMTSLDGGSPDVEDQKLGRRRRSLATACPSLPSHVAAFALAVVLAVAATPDVTTGQLPVIDAANLIQTTMTTLKMVESVVNEVEMIANQVRQIENMIQNTRNYGRGIWDAEALPRLVRLGQVIDQEQAIAYSMANIDGLFRVDVSSAGDAIAHGVPLRTSGALARWQARLRKYPEELAAARIEEAALTWGGFAPAERGRRRRR